MYGRSSISCIISVVCRIMTTDWCPQFVVCSPGWYLLTAVCCLLCTVLCLYPYYISLIYIYLLPTVLILCKAWKVYNRLRENLTNVLLRTFQIECNPKSCKSLQVHRVVLHPLRSTIQMSKFPACICARRIWMTCCISLTLRRGTFGWPTKSSVSEIFTTTRPLGYVFY